jgi:hypothetical protein
VKPRLKPCCIAARVSARTPVKQVKRWPNRGSANRFFRDFECMGTSLISFSFYSTFSPDTNLAETLLGWTGSTDSH